MDGYVESNNIEPRGSLFFDITVRDVLAKK